MLAVHCIFLKAHNLRTQIAELVFNRSAKRFAKYSRRKDIGYARHLLIKLN